jgi:hypothetical protein
VILLVEISFLGFDFLKLNGKSKSSLADKGFVADEPMCVPIVDRPGKPRASIVSPGHPYL